jgi:hypothetical protein
MPGLTSLRRPSSRDFARLHLHFYAFYTGDGLSAKVNMLKSVLQPRHTDAGRLLPTREALLDAMPKYGIVAEVGVGGGNFAAEILRRCMVQRFHLVDAWSSERYASDFELVRTRFAGELATGLAEINRGVSEEVLSSFPDSYFDWVYIDSDHGYATTLSELSICRHKVRPGGSIAGHDFCVGNVTKLLCYGVIQAVNDFCIEHNWGYDYLTMESHGHFSFCIRAL